MGIKFSNNASSNITHALTADATSVSITPGTGDLFPSIVEGTDYFYATLAGNNGLEIVKVTRRVLDTMTVERAQDGTSALLFNQGDLFELRIVAADFEDTFAKVDSMLEESLEANTSMVNSALASKAPTSHASANTTHGVGTEDLYGHVKLSDDVNSSNGISQGIAATPLAVSKAQATAKSEAVSEAVGEASSQISSLDSTLRTFIEEKTAEYLPLTGGTMSGGVYFDVEEQSGLNIVHSASHSSGYLQLCGGTAYATGASLALNGTDNSNNPGAFILHAQGSGTNKLLVGRPNGTLMWGGENVVRSVNGRGAGSDGSVRTWAINKGDVSANTLLEEGSYYLTGNNTDLPSGTNGYVIVHSVNTAGMIRQVFFRAGTVDSNDYNTYIRQRSSDGTWGAWVKILTSKDTITASTATSATNATKAACLSNITSAVKTSSTTSTTSKQGSCTVSTTAYTSDGTKYYKMTVTLPSGGSWHWVSIAGVLFKTGRSSGGTAIEVGDTGMFLAMRYA